MSEEDPFAPTPAGLLDHGPFKTAGAVVGAFMLAAVGYQIFQNGEFAVEIEPSEEKPAVEITDTVAIPTAPQI